MGPIQADEFLIDRVSVIGEAAANDRLSGSVGSQENAGRSYARCPDTDSLPLGFLTICSETAMM